ncbi:hypothetical protein [Rhizomonospora bruguierae]|uniref:hypothetical protein n=1 Tax=Rhizomonospora bruguierae TaxID=1581705 RepID=UPI001BCA9BC7|nr:hypothetical protein [Micromonospora sp. NBRC 107566]
MSLREAVEQAFTVGGVDPPHLLDPGGRIRRLSFGGTALVAKRCPAEAVRRELASATRARQLLRAAPIDAPLEVRVVVPDLIELAGGACALVAADLGETLAAHRADVARWMPRQVVEAMLWGLLDAGIEWSGFVPRNLFVRDAGLYAIDWEDARFCDGPARPDEVTVAKWDVGWSDVYRADPSLRAWFSPRQGVDSPLDDFEMNLRELSAPGVTGAEIRTRGAELTLRSELYAPVPTGDLTPAELGHLADELLPAPWSVFHTALTAWARPRLGDTGYAALISTVCRAVGPLTADHDATATLPTRWIRALLLAVDEVTPDQSCADPLSVLAEQVTALAGHTGLEAAERRAGVAEAILVRVCDLVVAALDLGGLQLLLRGSLAQGVITGRSDIDFELSAPAHPRGHAGAEALVVDVLASFGITAEATAGRPVEADLGGPDAGTTRDLHEWMELRRPGSAAHDPGWLGAVIRADLARLATRQSEYERAGREHSAKYLWFEARAALARVVMRAAPGVPPVTVLDQLAALPELLGHDDAQELRAIVLGALDQRELDHADPARCADLRGRLDAIRERHGLPGPA